MLMNCKVTIFYFRYPGDFVQATWYSVIPVLQHSCFSEIISMNEGCFYWHVYNEVQFNRSILYFQDCLIKIPWFSLGTLKVDILKMKRFQRSFTLKSQLPSHVEKHLVQDGIQVNLQDNSSLMKWAYSEITYMGKSLISNLDVALYILLVFLTNTNYNVICYFHIKIQ